ncbi:MAG: cyclic nucleotide-binding and patatin-like phospholipase domain-containing protein [Salibacteraceae bacterium]
MNIQQSLLREAAYFKDLDEEAFLAVESQGQLIEVKCGETLMQQGETTQDAYILLDGRLRAYHQREGETDQMLGDIGKGEIVGEMAAIFGSPRNATVVALRHSTLLQLSSTDFLALVQSQKNSSIALSKTIIERSKPSFLPNSRLATVALVPTQPGIELEVFLGQLTEAIGKYVAVRHLSAHALREAQQQGEYASEAEALEALVAESGEHHQLLLFEAEATWSTWTQAAVARADKIIWLADAGQSPVVSSFENSVTEACQALNHAAHELVLLHPSRDQAPDGTRHWLQARHLSRHYHVARNHIADIQRLARFLTGNAIGVALSGGGARSSVQMGVLQALLEGGIPVDIIGGTSGGALIGGNFAQISDSEEFRPIVEEGQEAFNGTRKLTLPLVSLYTGNRFTKAIKKLAHGKNIEDLWINFFCLSLSLVKGKLVEHRQGPLWEALRASMAVNGIVPPLMKNDDCLVDGGLINACPTDLLAKMGAGKSIAIVASSKSGIAVDASFAPEVSGWDILLKRLNPFHKKKILPSLTTNIVQSIFIASDHLQYRIFADSKVDLFIHPPIDSFNSMDTDATIKLYEFGYEYGLTQVDHWRNQLNITH